MEPIQQPKLAILSGRGVMFACLLSTCLTNFGVGSAVGQTLWPENGHYYLIVDQTTTWQQARLLAEAMMFMGVQGQLATITSEDQIRSSLLNWATPREPGSGGNSFPAARSRRRAGNGSPVSWV